MSSSFFSRHLSTLHGAATPQRRTPQHLDPDDGPHTPVSFMPQQSSSAMMALSSTMRPSCRTANEHDFQLLTPSSDGSMEKHSLEDREEDMDEKHIGSESSNSSRTSDAKLARGPNNAVADADTTSPTPLSKLLTRLHIHVPELHFDTIMARLVLVLILLSVGVVIERGLDRITSFFVGLLSYILSALWMISGVLEWVLESAGFLVGRAVAKTARGFVRGYYLE